jgi:uncharacterized protein
VGGAPFVFIRTEASFSPISIYNWHVARKRKIQLKCPICKKAVVAGAEDFPFCSDRCRLIDLGKWASGQYVITSPVQDTGDDMLEHSDLKDGEDD